MKLIAGSLLLVITVLGMSSSIECLQLYNTKCLNSILLEAFNPVSRFLLVCLDGRDEETLCVIIVLMVSTQFLNC